MKQHKWHKEIKAWADGAEIEVRTPLSKYTASQVWNKFDSCVWALTALEGNKLLDVEYRIKPQEKYLYVYLEPETGNYKFNKSMIKIYDRFYIGKIKLEVDDE